MKKGNKGKIIAIALLLIAALAVNIACSTLNPMITSWMGVNLNPLLTGKKSVESAEILSVAEATEQSLAMAEKLENEGIVLLRNENSALPLASGTKVNLFGYASVDPIYGGTGSGSGDTSANVDVVKGLTNSGLQVNDQLVTFYKNSGVSRAKQGGYTGSNFTPAEVSADKYTDGLLQSARSYADVAILVISRIGGEGGDLPMDMYAAGYSKTDDGRHYLELTQDEEDLLDIIKGQNYEKVIVLINSSNAMELGFVEGVDAALWIGSPGAVGFNAVGKALTGEVNPSGRLTDIYAYDLTTSPAYYNAGSFTYGNLKRNYVEYAEGIYVGYHYYETAAADGFIDYESTVQYPFGYGLSYTTFSQSIESFVDGGGNIIMQVKVTNTGAVAGKDVAQVYYTAPYTKGGIEKAHVVLGGFAKTKLLNPGESQTLTISFREEDMASFDSKNAGCYVLEEGTYSIKLMSNSHDVIDSRDHTAAKTITYGEGNARSTDKIAAVPRFSDVENGQITVYVSRANWEGTFPKSRADGKEASAEVVDAFTNKAPYAVNVSDPAIVYKDNGLTLEDMAGLSWDDPKWELLLQQLSDDDMAKMILNGGWSTPAVESVGKPATSDLDGPAGINSLVSSLRGVSFPSEAVIGATWNVELVEEFGQVFGAEAIANGVVGLYAPGMNIHRTPFSGRNFEYYSEDALLSGKLGAAQVKGAASQGVYMYAKHYALNDQESNRLSLSVWVSEQAMRELYLKPFEITVKEGKTTAIMSSYSYLGTTWAGASHALITDVLRSEWGFTGMVVTDSAMANTSWMDPNLAVRAGNDMMLCLMGASIDSSNNTARIAMREACHNILYTQANSAAVQVESDNTPYWYALVALFNAIVLSVIIILLLKMTGKKVGWKGLIVFLLVLAISAAVLWFGFFQPKARTKAAKEESASAVEVQTTEAPAVTEAPAPEAQPAAEEKANEVSPETGMELYDLADFWLGCHVNINADNTFTVAYDYGGENNGIESAHGTWERISETELTLKPESGDPIPVTLTGGAWTCEVTEPNTHTVCHPKVEVGTAEPAVSASITPETGMELYDLADFWLGCHVYVNADNTFSVTYDYGGENNGIESLNGAWERVSDTELTLKPESGDPISVTLTGGAWTCEVTEPNTHTVCHPKVEVGTAEPAVSASITPETGMELYDLADFWLGCHVYVNADNTFSVAYDYGGENNGIESASGTWERISETELTLHPEGGDDIPVTLSNGVWACEVTEPNTQTKCHPKAEVGAAETAVLASITPETGMELYDLADFWLGCHVNINADNTFTVAYDYGGENNGIESAHGTWERISETELTLHPDGGDDIPITLADGVWICEVKEPNTQTVCHPKVEVGETAAAEQTAPSAAEPVTYTIQYMDADGTVYATIETADASTLPETEIPVKEGYTFAGWQTRPNVTKNDLVLGVSPYEVPAGASSLYGGAGTAIDKLESTDGTAVTVFARWAEPTLIHNAAELQAMGEDLYGYYILAGDIDLTKVQWIPVGMYFSNYETVNAPYWTYAFRGTLDGAGHKLTGLTIGNFEVDTSVFATEGIVWRNDGSYSGSEAALFGAAAKADIHDLVIDKPAVTIQSDGDATPYAAVVAGFDIGTKLTNITVNEPVVSVTVSDANAQSRASAWAAVSGLVAGGWSDIITNCNVTDAKITLNAETVRSHGGEFYAGSMLGEGYAFMDGNSATYELAVSVTDKSAALSDAELIVNVGGMGGTNTTQTNGAYEGKMNVSVVKPVGAATVSIGGLTGSQRYQVAENNTIKAEITTDCQLDSENGKLYVGKVIGSTNIPYCIVQLIFAGPGDVAYSGCGHNQAEVTLNGEAVQAAKGQALTVKGEPLPYIANGDLTNEATGETYVSNINDVIAEYGSAVPASFLQNAVIVIVDE
ncbi:MAG: glycoside hydrolase family 3 C-terminal domain-containing protein [Clostridia bacterium]|nr:glycoside hydrolase family 3 C-terminal domain-containing protein [Clostridia bacterium]